MHARSEVLPRTFTRTMYMHALGFPLCWSVSTAGTGAYLGRYTHHADGASAWVIERIARIVICEPHPLPERVCERLATAEMEVYDESGLSDAQGAGVVLSHGRGYRAVNAGNEESRGCSQKEASTSAD